MRLAVRGAWACGEVVGDARHCTLRCAWWMKHIVQCALCWRTTPGTTSGAHLTRTQRWHGVVGVRGAMGNWNDSATVPAWIMAAGGVRWGRCAVRFVHGRREGKGKMVHGSLIGGAGGVVRCMVAFALSARGMGAGGRMVAGDEVCCRGGRGWVGV